MNILVLKGNAISVIVQIERLLEKYGQNATVAEVIKGERKTN